MCVNAPVPAMLSRGCAWAAPAPTHGTIPGLSRPEARVGWLFTLIVLASATWWVVRRFAAASDAGTSAPSVLDSVSFGSRLFKISFEDGRTAAVDGRVPRNALHAFEDIASRAGLTGDVVGLSGDTLRFSATIPEGTQQQFRNAWFAAKTVH